MPRRRTYPRPAARPLVRRVLAVLVIVGYGLVLAGSSAGHGWSLLVHLVTERHEAEPVAAHAAGHPAASHPGSGSVHGEHAHGGAPHEHDDRTHTHERDRDADPDAPAVLTVALDKHCLFSGAALSPPPLQERDEVRPSTVFSSAALPVEVPPPRTLS